MKLADYMAHIKAGEIPPESPDGTTRDGYGFPPSNPNRWTEYWYVREECIKRGLWIIIAATWVAKLAQWLGNHRVLEIMAGGGWLAKALSEQDVEVIATDDFSWMKMRHKGMSPVYPVQKIDAVEAVKSIDADILLVSWPPYGDDTICRACEAWGTERQIIYIGEGSGGYGAPKEFFERFRVLDDAPDIALMSWDSIHDHVFIGRWLPIEPLRVMAGTGGGSEGASARRCRIVENQDADLRPYLER